MKKFFFYLTCLCLCVSILVGGTTKTYAAEKHLNSDKKISINRIQNNPKRDIKLEDTKILTTEDVSEINKYSDVKIKNLDDKTVELVISDKTPEKIIYYNDGSKEEYYSTSIIYASQEGTVTSSAVTGNLEEYYNDGNVKLYAKMNYSKYYDSRGDQQTRLIYGGGKLVTLYENGCRNLKIIPRVFGSWLDPSGARGLSGYITYPKTIANPTIGTLYTSYTNNSHYYSTGTGSGQLQVKISVEWRHGTSWYTTIHTIDLGM